MQLATPAALILVIGLALVYFALRGWDSKYQTFGGALAGK